MIEYIYSLDTGGQFETDALLSKKINEIIHYINDNKIKNNNYISKDKIRDEIKLEKENIESLKNSSEYGTVRIDLEIKEKYLKIDILNELLEEK